MKSLHWLRTSRLVIAKSQSWWMPSWQLLYRIWTLEKVKIGSNSSAHVKSHIYNNTAANTKSSQNSLCGPTISPWIHKVNGWLSWLRWYCLPILRIDYVGMFARGSHVNMICDDRVNLFCKTTKVGLGTHGRIEIVAWVQCQNLNSDQLQALE